jgi:hypothetical protein
VDIDAGVRPGGGFDIERNLEILELVVRDITQVEKMGALAEDGEDAVLPLNNK